MNIGYIFILIITVLPFILLKIKKIKPIYLALLASIIVYILIISYTFYIDYKFDVELNSFDLNKDGVFSGKEITIKQVKAFNNVINDTARNLAPLTGMIFSMAYFLSIFIIMSVLNFITKKLKQ